MMIYNYHNTTNNQRNNKQIIFLCTVLIMEYNRLKKICSTNNKYIQNTTFIYAITTTYLYYDK